MPDDPLKPSVGLLIKLGSLVVHADEFFSPGGDPVDRIAFNTLIHDEEVKAWISAMGCYLPLKRSVPPTPKNNKAKKK